MRFWSGLAIFEDRLAAIGAGAALMIIMLVSVAGVLGRYVLQMDLIPGAYNLIERVIFPLMVFWALPAAHREFLFPRLEMVVEGMRPAMGRAVSLVVLAVEIAVYGIVLWFVTKFLIQSYATSRTMQVGTDFWLLWPILTVIPFAFGLMVLEMLRQFWVDARWLAGGNDA